MILNLYIYNHKYNAQLVANLKNFINYKNKKLIYYLFKIELSYLIVCNGLSIEELHNRYHTVCDKNLHFELRLTFS